MKLEEREILRKKRILQYAEACGNVLRTWALRRVAIKLLYLARRLPTSGQCGPGPQKAHRQVTP